MSEKQRKIIVTAALPYANGDIHMGHMLEYIQTDIWVRFQKLRGHDCQFVWASDAHGTPIMLSAQKKGISPEALIESMHNDHTQVFDEFLIAYDNFHTTHSPENQEIVNEIYTKLKQNGHINEREIEQAYDAEAKMFLPDRFIRGTCPTCKTPEQYGDSCESCGATYNPIDLIDAVSVVSGSKPIQKKTLHHFFALSNFSKDLETLVNDGLVPQNMASKLKEWFDAGLKDWDITRDEPYFGFKIPGTEDKYFYVWLDAPIGYMASHKNLSEKTGKNDYPSDWQIGSETEIYHFIGKDIVYFHALFWPAVLKGSGYKTPTRIFPHGFLTVDGQKMSKSRGTYIKARTYLDNLKPEYLRYYYAAKLNSSVEDIDLNLEDFVQKVNSDLVGKLVNIASRCAGFIHKIFDGELSDELHDEDLYQEMIDSADFIAGSYEDLEYHRAMREIMRIADIANRYIDDQKPWILAKQMKEDPALAKQVQQVCTQGLNSFRVLVHFLKPVLPELSQKAETFLNVTSTHWNDIQNPLLAHKIEKFVPLLTRVESKTIDKIIEASKEDLQESGKSPTQTNSPALEKEIQVDDFFKVDLRVARILKAESVEGSSKLLKLTLDVGDHQRVVFSGIKANYAPEAIEGRLTVVVANLKPRKMRFGVSEGMVLCASGKNSDGEEDIFLMNTDSGAQPGMRIS